MCTILVYIFEAFVPIYWECDVRIHQYPSISHALFFPLYLCAYINFVFVTRSNFLSVCIGEYFLLLGLIISAQFFFLWIFFSLDFFLCVLVHMF